MNESLQRLQQLHLIAHHYGCDTVALSIPEPGQERQFLQVKLAREQLNNKLQEWAATTHTANDAARKCTFVDIASCIPQSESQFWDFDGLHYTPAGYDKIADVLFEQAAEALSHCRAS